MRIHIPRRVRRKVHRCVEYKHKKWQEVADTLEDYPFDTMLSIALILFGARALVTGLNAAPGSVQNLPLFMAIIYCILAALGGLCILVGLALRRKLTWFYGIVRAGLLISAAAWASYIVGLAFSPTVTGTATLLILALGALAIGCLLRSRAINRKAKAQLIALRHAMSTREEVE